MLLEIKYLRIIIVLLGLSFKQAIVAQEGSYEISVPRLQESVKIDGVLNEEVWNSAASFSNFSQVEPKSFAKPSQKTEVRVFSTSSALYIGVKCFDTEPDKILYKERRRDNPGRGDDRVRIAFDTFGRGTNYYYFGVAGGGGKADGVVKAGSRPDLTWDTIWDCDTSLDSEGWYVEFEIPFRSLAFDKNNSVWGFNIEREIRRNNEKLDGLLLRDYVLCGHYKD